MYVLQRTSWAKHAVSIKAEDFYSPFVTHQWQSGAGHCDKYLKDKGLPQLIFFYYVVIKRMGSCTAGQYIFYLTLNVKVLTDDSNIWCRQLRLRTQTSAVSQPHFFSLDLCWCGSAKLEERWSCLQQWQWGEVLPLMWQWEISVSLSAGSWYHTSGLCSCSHCSLSKIPQTLTLLPKCDGTLFMSAI